MQELVPNRPWLLWSKATVVSAKGKVPAGPGQMSDRKLNGSEPLMKCRKNKEEVRTAKAHYCGISQGGACLWPWRPPACRRQESITGGCEERGNLRSRCKPRLPSGRNRKGQSRNAAQRGGMPRSSVEVSDKGMERRGRGHEGWSIKPTGNGRSL